MGCPAMFAVMRWWKSSAEKTPALTVVSRTSFNMTSVAGTSSENTNACISLRDYLLDTITGLPNSSCEALALPFLGGECFRVMS